MKPRIYVAASSAELERARRAMDLVVAEGWELANDWVSTIQAVGEANPADASDEERSGWAVAAIEAVRKSDALWFLVPQVGHGRGAYVELGCAATLWIPIVVSGPGRAQSIFTAYGVPAATDDDAMSTLRGWLGRANESRGGR